MPAPPPDADEARRTLRPTEAEALAAWRALQHAAAEQGERMREQAPPADEWGAMADIFAPGRDAYPAPELPLLEALARPDDHWLEVGAGAGRLAIPLARRVRRMSALDRSPGMTARLREEAAASGLDNFEVLPATGWPPPGVPGDAAPIVDVALTASVLFFIEEIGAFLDALEGHARRLCVVVLMDRMPGTPLEPLWSGLYDEPPAELPALREFLAVLGARGRTFDLRATQPPPPPSLSLDEVIDSNRHRYFVSRGTAREGRMRELLAERYAGADGLVALPLPFSQTAVVSWAPPPR